MPTSQAKSRLGDRLFRWITAGSAMLLLLVVVGLGVELLRGSSLSLERFGVGFLTSQEWNPAQGRFGAASSIFGTLVSTLLALVIAVPLSLVIALFLVELAPPRVSRVVGTAIELLAAIPSIIYGMWGLFVFAPLMAKHVQPALGSSLGWLPLFKGPPMGIGMLTASLILALMILPFVTAVMRDVFQMVPAVVKESAYGMGATTWEVTRQVTVRFGFQGLVGATFLGLGRAIGETMAVTFVIGNKHTVDSSLFSAGNSIASTLANEFTEAAEPLYRSALVELGLILLLITVVIQIAAQLWLRRLRRTLAVGA
jgi:phosphate transport system permease protein